MAKRLLSALGLIFFIWLTPNGPLGDPSGNGAPVNVGSTPTIGCVVIGSGVTICI